MRFCWIIALAACAEVDASPSIDASSDALADACEALRLELELDPAPLNRSVDQTFVGVVSRHDNGGLVLETDDGEVSLHYVLGHERLPVSVGEAIDLRWRQYDFLGIVGRGLAIHRDARLLAVVDDGVLTVWQTPLAPVSGVPGGFLVSPELQPACAPLIDRCGELDPIALRFRRDDVEVIVPPGESGRLVVSGEPYEVFNAEAFIRPESLCSEVESRFAWFILATR